MAWTADSVYEIRPDGALANGVGFSPSFAGTDFSQSATPILTVTDAAGTGTTSITSATGGFTVSMQGNGIHVNSNLYQIITRTSSNAVVVDRATGSFSGQTANVGGAGGAKGTAVSSLEPYEFSVVVPGNIIWVRDTNSAGVVTAYASTIGSNIGINGAEENYVRVEGYSLVRGDGGIAHLAKVGNWTAEWTVFKNLMTSGSFAGATVSAGALGQIIENCIFDATSTAGYALEISALQIIRRCWIKGGTNVAAIRDTGGNLLEFCRIDAGAGQAGVSVEGGSPIRLSYCVVDGGAVGVQINANSTGAILRNSVLWGASQYGLDITPTSLHFGEFSTIESCIFGNNTLYDIAYRQTSPATVTGPGGQTWVDNTFKCNDFFTTGVGRYLNMPAAADDTTLTAIPFTSAGTGDFSLNAVAGGGALISASICKENFADLLNSSSILAGLTGVLTTAQPPATVTMRNLWRELTNERNTQVIPDSVVDIYLDWGLQQIYRQIRYYVVTDSTEVTLVPGVQEYVMPADAIEIVWVQYGTNRLLEKGDVEQWRRLGEDWRNEVPAEPLYWAHYGGNHFVIRPAPSALAVSQSPNLTIRRKATPPSITTAGPDQLPSIYYRLVVMYGAYLWSAAYPDSVVATQRATALKAEFDAGMVAATEDSARKSIAL